LKQISSSDNISIPVPSVGEARESMQKLLHSDTQIGNIDIILQLTTAANYPQ